jgi:glutamyl/glutaminyl-tRNA synthetase
MLTHTLNLIQQIPVEKWSSKSVQLKLNQALEELEAKPAILFALLRNALTGAKFTPPLVEMMAVLGGDEIEERLLKSIKCLI